MTHLAETPTTTLFIGAPTRLGHAVNAFVRKYATSLGQGGVTAFPNKIVTHALRAAIGDAPEPDELQNLIAAAAEKRLFLSALFAMGRPGTAVRDDELFPEAERMLSEISAVLDGQIARVVVAIEPLHHLLLSVEREQVYSRSRGVRWDVLYEVSWAELLDVVETCFTEAEIAVLTPYSIDTGPTPVLHYLFGNKGFELASHEAGSAFFDAAKDVPSCLQIREQTGLDKVACDLLLQRFREDVDAISKRSRLRVF
ncbi:MAG: hypothetical protein HKP54_14670 [Boseongicola sp.]|nr:hypothetical protein [Boseongicola sp.]